MADFGYPSNAELALIEQDKLPRLIADRPIFQDFPIVTADAALVMWEQRDNWTGLQQARGLNGAPPKVARIGASRFQMQPGVYGEQLDIDELELTTRRAYGSFASPVAIDDLVMEAQDLLLGRRLDRIEAIIWTLFTSGTFSVPGPNGAIVHTDTFSLQTYAASVAWTTSATATPLANLRAIQLLARGHSVNFGAQAKIYMNRVTANSLLANTNTNDVAGRRTGGFGTFNSIAELNTLFTMDDLPNVVVYDEGYLTEGSVVSSPPYGTFTPFIPNGTAVVVGKRPGGAPVGQYKMTRNANNPGLAPGAYMKVIDLGETTVPRSIAVHDGHSGGPAIMYPTAVVTVSGL